MLISFDGNIKLLLFKEDIFYVLKEHDYNILRNLLRFIKMNFIIIKIKIILIILIY